MGDKAPRRAKQGAGMAEVLDNEAGTVFVGGAGEGHGVAQHLLLKYANRHGLIAGATGTGKTVTLQTLAESLSLAGVPVFLSDVKGDLAGLSRPGGTDPKLAEPLTPAPGRSASIWTIRAFPSPSGMSGARWATRSAPPPRIWGRCCCRACWG